MPPTENYIKELLNDRREYFSSGENSLHAHVRETRSLRYMENEIKIPENYKASTQVIHLPTIPDMLLRIVSTLTADDPKIQVPPPSSKLSDQRNSSLRERWTSSALKRMQLEQDRPVLRMGIDAACADGLGVWKIIDKRDVWNGEPKRKKRGEDAQDYLDRVSKFRKGAKFPIVWFDLDVLNYFPVHNGLELVEVLEVSKQSAIPAMKALGVKKLPNGEYTDLRPGEVLDESQSYGTRILEVGEYWSNNYAAYTLDGNLVKEPIENKYGRPPYFPVAGHTTSSRDPAKAYASVVEPFKHLIPALERLLTMKTNWAYLAAWPFMTKEDSLGPVLLPDNAEDVADIEPGRILSGVKFMSPGNVGRDVDQLIEILRLMIDRSGLAAVMYGQGAASSSGYMVSQLLTAAQIVYRPILANAEMTLSRCIEHIWRIVESVLADDVYVWGDASRRGQKEWLALTPKDIDGYYAVNVSMRPLLPMDEIAQGDAAIRLVGSGLVSRRYARERKLAIESPEEMADEVAVERYMDSPEIQQRIMLDAAKEAGLIPEPPPPPPPGIIPPEVQGTGGPINPVGPIVPGMETIQPPPLGTGIAAGEAPPGMPPGIGGPPIVIRRPGGNIPNPAEQL